MKHLQLFENYSAVKVWYHGSDNKFTDFNEPTDDSKGPSGLGTWFSDDPEFSKMFGENIMSVELSFNNPKIISMDKWDSIRSRHAKDKTWFRNWRNELIDAGHDALFVKERIQEFAGIEVRDANVVAVFDTSQIKQLSNNK